MRPGFAFLLLVTVPLAAADLPPAQTFATTLTRRAGYSYLLFKPAGYEAAPERRWPLLLFLHGSGERGDKLERIVVHGPPKLLSGSPKLTAAEKSAAALLAENFLVLAPQCPDGRVWDDDTLLALLDDAAAKLRVDPRRVYVSGLSMGGYGTWALLARAPERFAAVAPICGGGSTIEFRVASRGRKTAYQPVAVWAFHGARDPSVPLAESQGMIEACKIAGMKDLTLTVYPAAEHDSWTETYANVELYAWLLRHQK